MSPDFVLVRQLSFSIFLLLEKTKPLLILPTPVPPIVVMTVHEVSPSGVSTTNLSHRVTVSVNTTIVFYCSASVLCVVYLPFYSRSRCCGAVFNPSLDLLVDKVLPVVFVCRINFCA